MFCPECRKAALTFVHKTSKRRAHLRRIANSAHKSNCSYNYEYAPEKRTIEYVQSLSNSQIQDKLDSIMNMLCGTHNKRVDDRKDMDTPQTAENPMLIPERNYGSTKKALRRKKLNSWIDQSDGEDLCAFYGQVKLIVKENEKRGDQPGDTYTFNLLEIYTKNKRGKWKFRTRLYRGKEKDSVNEDSVYNIVLIGRLNFKYNPFGIKLARKDAIRYQEA